GPVGHPRRWRPVVLAVERHGAADRALARWILVQALRQQAAYPETPRAGAFVLEAEHLLAEGKRERVGRVRWRTRAGGLRAGWAREGRGRWLGGCVGGRVRWSSRPAKPSRLKAARISPTCWRES